MSRRATTRDRIRSALATAAVIGAIGYGFIAGLSVPVTSIVTSGMQVFDVTPKPPPPPVRKEKPQPVVSRKPEGAASPPNLTAKATEIVAPPPPIPIPQPPVVTSTTPDVGAATHSGAAPVAGPGSGAGGTGSGTGSGRSGSGGGDGGTPIELLSGHLKSAMLPKALLKSGARGTVYLSFVVGVKGRVTSCVVTHSSGSAMLDTATCNLIERELRYRPATDASGRKIPQTVTGQQEWEVYGADGDDNPPDD